MSTKMRRVESRGASLMEIVITVGLVVIVAIVVIGFLIERAVKQAPSRVQLNGARQIVSGDPNGGDFRITLVYPRAFPTATDVKVVIFEDDTFGNDLLAEVTVRIPPGGNLGTALFKLTCDETGLRGDKGASPSEPIWQIFARVVKQDESLEAVSDNKEVICGQPNGE